MNEEKRQTLVRETEQYQDKLDMRHLFVAIFVLSAATAFGQTAPQNVDGCQPLPSNSIFYARIDSLPVLAQSAEYIANLGSSTLSFDSAIGVTLADNTTPVRTFSFLYTPGYNSISWVFPPYYQFDREGGSMSEDAGDHHSITVQHQTCKIYDLYHDYVSPVTGTIQPAACGSTQCTANSGFQYGSSTTALPAQGTTDAAGLPLLPLIWRAREIMDGTLNHPIRFTMGRYNIQAGHPMWPAEGTNGLGSSAAPPYGARFRLAASTNINISSLTPIQQQYAQTIINALERYGLVLADIGSNLNASVDDETDLNPDIIQALSTVGSQVHPSNLQAVDMSSLQMSASSYLTSAAPTFDPANQALVGTPSTFLNIQAGVTGYQLKSWVNGSADQEVTWSVQSGNIGTITPDGLYTPPANVSGIVTGVLKATAAVDASAYATVYVHVIPAGAIRVIAGNRSTGMTDKLGQAWMPNMFLLAGDSTALAGDYPGWPTPSNSTQAAEINVYQSSFYTYGDDIVGNFVVPNGNYKIRLMFGQPYDGHSATNCTFSNTLHAPLLVEGQYLPVAHNFDFGNAVNHQCAIPTDLYVPATVTANTLEFALRNTSASSNSEGSPMLSGVEIEPDSSAPTLTIDTQQQTSVAAGSNLQLYAVGWYIGDSVTWQILSGPGSISSTGLYTAPTAAPTTAQTVTIKANSTINPHLAAIITLTIL